MPGAGLSDGCTGKALSDMRAFQPHWGKPAVRNDRGTVETSASCEARYAPLSYPTAGGRSAMVVPTATPDAFGYMMAQ
jgi:hypothetical protein